MKKRTGILLAVAVVIVFAFALWTKYDTRGVYPGTEAGKMFSVNLTQKLEERGTELEVNGHTHTWLYKNAFGRTVVVNGLIMTHTDSLWDQLCQRFGGVVWQAQTVPAGFKVTTHLDFFRTYGQSGLSLISLIEKAGEPSEYWSMDQPHYCFETWDGYTYVVMAMVGDKARLANIIDPQGNYMEEQEIALLTQRVLIQYLVLAAVLSAILIVLLTVPKAVRKRKAEKLQNQEG